MSFVVFLDVDGVLNTRTTCRRAPSELYTGIDEMRIQILAGAMNRCNASGVVLTSTWKNLKPDHEDYIYLKEGLSNKGIEILGKTEDPHIYQRGIGVLNYLNDHSEIDEFVIIDDQHFDFQDSKKLWENYIDTGGRGIENSVCASKMPTVSAILFCDAIEDFSKCYNSRAMSFS